MKRLITIIIISILFITTGLTQPKYYSEEAAPPIVPRWAFEPWVWEDNGNTQGSLLELIHGYEKHRIPTGVVIIDSPWQTSYNTFIPDSIRYPEIQVMLDDLHNRDYRVIMWMSGMFNITAKDVPHAKHPEYEWIKEQGYVVDNGEDHQWWKGRGMHIDLTNKQATDWWHEQMDNMLEMGIDGWKVDGTPDLVYDPVETSKGKMPIEEFVPLYYKDVYEYSTSKNPNTITLGRAYSYQNTTESGLHAPIAQCAVGWCGDFGGGWDGMQHQMDNIYRSAQAGYGALACEIGGFKSTSRPNKEQLIRYTQLGAFCPVMINGGKNGGLTHHLPWFHDDETVEIYRYFASLHSELVPYIFSYNVEAHITSGSVIKDSDIEKAHHRLGNDIFVSPIINDDLFKHVYFPDQHYWIDYWNQDQVYRPDTSIYYSASLRKTPLFIKAGAIIPMNVKNSTTGHGSDASAGKQTLMIYPYRKSDFVYHRPVEDGIEYTDIFISVNEQHGTIKVNGDSKESYRIRIKSFQKPDAVSGVDSWTYSEKENIIICDIKGSSFTVKIDKLTGYSKLIK